MQCQAGDGTEKTASRSFGPKELAEDLLADEFLQRPEVLALTDQDPVLLNHLIEYGRARYFMQQWDW